MFVLCPYLVEQSATYIVNYSVSSIDIIVPGIIGDQTVEQILATVDNTEFGKNKILPGTHKLLKS